MCSFGSGKIRGSKAKKGWEQRSTNTNCGAGSKQIFEEDTNWEIQPSFEGRMLLVEGSGHHHESTSLRICAGKSIPGNLADFLTILLLLFQEIL